LRRDCSLFHDDHRMVMHSPALDLTQSIEAQDHLRNFSHLVSLYSQRQLTYDSDALHAFSGVMEKLQDQTDAMILRTMSGLPIIAHTTNGNLRQASPFIALSWCGWESQRRDVLPSWTWAGWRGPTFWPFRGMGSNWKAFSAMKDIVMTEKNGTPVSIRANTQSNMLDCVAAIEFDAPMVPSAAFTSQLEEFPWDKEDLEDMLLWGARVNLDPSFGRPEFFLDQIEKGNWSCLLLGTYESRTTKEITYLLVIEWLEGNTAIRLGSITVDGFNEDNVAALERRRVNLV
jgi:hypothetical protein